MNRSNDISGKIRALMDTQRLTEASLAERAKVAQSTVHRVVTGEISSPRLATLEKIAEALGTTAQALAYGLKEPDTTVQTNAVSANQVPLFTTAQLKNKESSEKTVICPVECGPQSFALVMPGMPGRPAPMVGSQGAAYPPGCIVYADPAGIKDLQTSDVVVAWVPAINEYVVRLLMRETGEDILMSLDQSFPNITGPIEIKAKVIGAWV